MDAAAGFRKSTIYSVKTVLSNRVALVFLVFFAIILASGILVPASLKTANITNVLRQASILGIVAIGQGIVMLSGGMDISIGNIMFAVMIYGGRFMESSPDRLIPVVLACIAAGGIIGIVNGLGVSKYKISPIIMTLGTSSILYGAVYIFGGNMMTSPVPSSLQQIGKKLLWGWFPITGICWFIVCAGSLFLLNRTTFGRRVYAAGNNFRAAWFGGARPIRTQIIAYVICDSLAALAGLLLLGYLGTPTLRFTDIYTIGSISAVVIGGIEFFSGIGHIGGAIAGTLIVRFLFNVLVMLRVPEAGRMIVEGVLIIAIVTLNRLKIRE